MENLPAELLIQIMGVALGDRRPLDLMNASQINSRARHTIVSSPEFWTKIQVKALDERSIERAKIFIPRSQALPVDLSLIVELGSDEVFGHMLEIISACSGRVRSFELDYSGEDRGAEVISILMIATNSSILESASLRYNTREHKVKFGRNRVVFLPSTPKLLHLVTSDIFLMPGIKCGLATIGLASLTTYTSNDDVAYGEPFNNIREVLSEASHLEELHLNRPRWLSRGYLQTIPLPPLHNLHTLFLSCDTALFRYVMQCLDSPNLSQVTWGDQNDHDIMAINDQFFADSSGPFKQHPNVRFLDVSRNPIHHLRYFIPDTFPNVERLVITAIELRKLSAQVGPQTRQHPPALQPWHQLKELKVSGAMPNLDDYAQMLAGLLVFVQLVTSPGQSLSLVIEHDQIYQAPGASSLLEELSAVVASLTVNGAETQPSSNIDLGQGS